MKKILILAILALSLMSAEAGHKMASFKLKVEITKTLEDNREVNGFGSGSYIGKGRILTAAHVIDEAESIVVLDDQGRRHDANVVWSHTGYDLAVLEISSTSPIRAVPVKCVTPGVGTRVMATGFPAGIDFISFWGRVGGTPRKEGDWKNVVILDMPVIPGISGSGLIDERGNLIGVNVGYFALRRSFLPMGAAVPAADFCRVDQEARRLSRPS